MCLKSSQEINEPNSFRDIFKILKVMPVLTRGEKKLTSNYRPISTWMLSALAQVFKNLICMQLVSYMQQRRKQFYPVWIHSTSQTITVISDNYEKPQVTTYILVWCFQTSPKLLILLTLKYCCLNRNPMASGVYHFNVLQVILLKENNTLHQKNNTCISSVQIVTCGIPQGSLVWPCFFIYNNDLPNSSGALVCLEYLETIQIYLPLLKTQKV